MLRDANPAAGFSGVAHLIARNVMKNILLIVLMISFLACSAEIPERAVQTDRIRVILDTDANNELDDQHAIAYLLFNGDVFDVEGITVNRTFNGGEVEKHFEEAERVVRLCGLHPQVRVYTGANGNFEEIRGDLKNPSFDGSEAVNFIIERAHATTGDRLVLLPVGKLTNIALALEKAPSIADKVRIVWLGSNYPDPGEYNQDNDEASMNYILDFDVPFEVVTVRYGKPSGTDAVRASLEEVRARMPGLGPRIDEPVVGRHGESFTSFGDYSVNLFENINLYGDPPSRALFDMAAVAIVKNPDWAEAKTIPAPILADRKWRERPDNHRTIVLWENFDRIAIMDDFYRTMEGPRLVY
jgi:purine nucleosidase